MPYTESNEYWGACMRDHIGHDTINQERKEWKKALLIDSVSQCVLAYVFAQVQYVGLASSMCQNPRYV